MLRAEIKVFVQNPTGLTSHPHGGLGEGARHVRGRRSEPSAIVTFKVFPARPEKSDRHTFIILAAGVCVLTRFQTLLGVTGPH